MSRRAVSRPYPELMRLCRASTTVSRLKERWNVRVGRVSMSSMAGICEGRLCSAVLVVIGALSQVVLSAEPLDTELV